MAPPPLHPSHVKKFYVPLVTKADVFYKNYTRGPVLGDGSQGVVIKYTSNSTLNGKKYSLVVKTLKNVDGYINRQVYEVAKSTMDQEEQILKDLPIHQRIITFIGSFRDPNEDNKLSIVLEFCAGGNLLEFFLEIKEGISEGQVYQVVRQLLQALEHCHSHHIVHRDVKLENVLLLGRYRRGRPSIAVKLADFGIAQKYNPEKDPLLTVQSGSPKYKSPELIAKAYNEKTDIWSTGVLAFMMLYGSAPFKPKTADIQEQKRLITKRLFTVNPELYQFRSKEAKDFVVEELMMQDYTKRKSAAELLEMDLMQFGFLGPDTMKRRIVEEEEEAALIEGSSEQMTSNFGHDAELPPILPTMTVIYVPEDAAPEQHESISMDGHVALQRQESIESVLPLVRQRTAGTRLTLDEEHLSKQRDFFQMLLAHEGRDWLVELMYRHVSLIFLGTKGRAKATALFKASDLDGNGVLNFHEFSSALDKYSADHNMVRIRKEVKKRLFESVDLDHSGLIELDEFVVAATDSDLFIENSDIESIFRAFDLDNNGRITSEEMYTVLHNLDKRVSREDIDNFIVKVDLNGDHQIDLEEFKAIFSTEPTVGTLNFLNREPI